MELLEIEKELAGADAEAALARYDAVLTGLGARAKAALDAGLPPEEYERCAALAESVTIARKLLRLQRTSRQSHAHSMADATSASLPIHSISQP